jgi:hypothetical protein
MSQVISEPVISFLKTFLEFLEDEKLFSLNLEFVDFKEHEELNRLSTIDSSYILVGTGNVCSDNDNAYYDYFLLNQKGKKDFTKDRIPSATKLVHDYFNDAFEDVKVWQNVESKKLSNKSEIASFLNQQTLYVEDASADSIISFIYLLIKIAVKKEEKLPDIWVSSVTDWEESGHAKNLDSNWCVLLTALTQFTRLDNKRDYVDAWRDGLKFAINAMLEKEVPTRLSESFIIQYGQLAANRQATNRLRYQLIFDKAIKFQSVLPLAGSGASTNYRLVDGVVLYLDEPITTYKNYFRSDELNSPLGMGFELIIYFNPVERVKKSKYAASISVTTQSQIELSNVWHALEQKEELRYLESGMVRAKDNPSEDLEYPSKFLDQYPEGKNHVRNNQPWFPISNDYKRSTERVTLVGNPPNCQLRFKDIESVFWGEANPAKFLYFLGADDKPVNLLNLESTLNLGKSPKVLFICKHLSLNESMGDSSHRYEESTKTEFLNSLTLERVIAARIEKPDQKNVSFFDIKKNYIYSKVELNEGFAIVSKSGAWVYDDWTDDHFDSNKVESAFNNACKFESELNKYQESLVHIRQEIAETQETHAVDFSDVLKAIFDIKSDIINSLNRFEGHECEGQEYYLKSLYAAFDKEWGLREAYHSINKNIVMMEESLKAREAVNSKWMLTALAYSGTIFGLTQLISDPIKKQFDEIKKNQNDEAGEQSVKANSIVKNNFGHKEKSDKAEHHTDQVNTIPKSLGNESKATNVIQNDLKQQLKTQETSKLKPTDTAATGTLTEHKNNSLMNSFVNTTGDYAEIIAILMIVILVTIISPIILIGLYKLINKLIGFYLLVLKKIFKDKKP